MTAATVTVFKHGLIVNPDARGETVVMLHHAGATAASLLPLARRLPGGLRVVLVDRPGRGIRSRQPRVETFDAVVADLEVVLAPFLNGPATIFGHSMGAMLAHEVAAASGSRGRPHATVVLSGTHPTRSDLLDVDLTSLSAVADRLRSLGGTPQEVLTEPALLQLAAATLVEDLAVLRTFRGATRLSESSGTTYHLWLGVDDPTLPTLDGSLWEKHAAVSAELTLFSGGHFYLFEDPRVPDALARLVSSGMVHGA